MVIDPGFDTITHTKMVSSNRSPTSVFAVAELNNVFRVPDDAIERGTPMDSQKQDNRGSMNANIRPMIRSVATDGELSTSSEDTEESNGEETPECNNGMIRPRLAVHQRPSSSSVFRPVGGNKGRCDFAGAEISVGNNGVFRSRFALPRRRQSALSIFRPVSGNKRRCDASEQEDDNHANISIPTKKRRPSAPLLCHANPIGCGSSDDDTCDSVDLPPMLSSSYSFALPFKRVNGNSSNTSSFSTGGASSFTTLFAADAATISNTQSSMEALDKRYGSCHGN